MSRKWISFPRVQGVASRQAHCDLPEGTYERELGREGFFGPATHMYHRHRPTAPPRALKLNARAFHLTFSAYSAFPFDRRRRRWL